MAPEGMFSMRAAIYLDDLTDEEGALNVIAGSHHALFSQQLAEMDLRSLAEPRAVPGRVALRNRPGDVVFMNHKVYHSALSARAGRRALHINCVQNPERSNAEHMDWLNNFLEGETNGWGRFYSDRLLATASPRRRMALEGALELGFGNTGGAGRGGGAGLLWPNWSPVTAKL